MRTAVVVLACSIDDYNAIKDGNKTKLAEKTTLLGCSLLNNFYKHIVYIYHFTIHITINLLKYNNKHDILCFPEIKYCAKTFC